jgi:hypothetical protein
MATIAVDRYVRACVRLELVRELIEAGVEVPGSVLMGLQDEHDAASEARADLDDDDLDIDLGDDEE